MAKLAIIQARCSSSRLPGKVLMPLHGHPMLWWLIERVRLSPAVAGVIVATSEAPSDDALEAWCGSVGVSCLRGPLDDVAKRFLMVAERLGADSFIRVNGDSPLLDPALLDRAVFLFENGDFDLVTNTRKRSFPKGQSVEVVSVAALASRHPGMSQDEKEHVTACFYRNPANSRIENFACDEDLGHIQMSVDTLDDFLIVERMMGAMDRPPRTYGLSSLLPLHRQAARSE